MNYDIIIAGAGPVGCIIAERCAQLLDWKVLLVDKRDHIAGNCYDYYQNGVLVHKYGPHYFRTNDDQILAYLSQFTEWIPGNYIVKSQVKDELYSFPINLDTLEKFFERKFTPESAKEFLAQKQIGFSNPKNSEEFVLSRVGEELYNNFYLGYTLKQWDMHPKDLSPSVCGRIPVRFNRDARYVDHKHQLIPSEGYTKLYENMINHPNITLKLNTDYFSIKDQVKPKKISIYTGPIDQYFDFKLGKLPWRSLEFEFKEYKKEFHQECVQINYPQDFSYTRSVETKHITNQKSNNTVVSYETPKADGDPYYPIPMAANEELYQKYKALAQEECTNNNVYFCGRLATYAYLNMDEVIGKALSLFDEIKTKHI